MELAALAPWLYLACLALGNALAARRSPRWKSLAWGCAAHGIALGALGSLAGHAGWERAVPAWTAALTLAGSAVVLVRGLAPGWLRPSALAAGIVALFQASAGLLSR